VNLTAAVSTAVGKNWPGTLQEIPSVHSAGFGNIRMILKEVLGLTK
jgi:hypothetical protein